MHLDELWWCLCRVIGAVRFAYTNVSGPSPLLPQNNALVLRRTPNRVDPDQPTGLSLASAGGYNLDDRACFLGSHMVYYGPSNPGKARIHIHIQN